LALLLLALCLPSIQAPAATCYPRDALQAHLAERYGERPVGAGVASGQLVELLTRPDGKSWTILVIRADGLACPVAAGEDWTEITLPMPEHGEHSS
jgi:hypothetical protein